MKEKNTKERERERERDQEQEVVEKKENPSSIGWVEFFGNTSGVRRSVGALFVFSLAIFFSLSFFSQAGVFGLYVNKGLGYVLGWGKWIFPLVLFLITWFLLQKSSRLYYVSIVGIGVSFITLLGILHLFIPLEEMALIASEGRSGGYVGYYIAWGMHTLFGLIASSVFLGIFFISGILVAFGLSLLPFVEIFRGNLLKKELFKKKGTEQGETQNFLEETSSEEKREKEKEEEYLKKDATNNSHDENEEEKKKKPSFAKNVQFEEDYRDSFVDEEGLLKKEASYYQELDDKGEEILLGEIQEKKGILKKRKKLTISKWTLPPLQFLEKSEKTMSPGDSEKKKKIIVDTLSQFGIKVFPEMEKIGPTVTQFRFRPAPGVRLEKIASLSSNLTYALAAHSIRVEAPIPGESLIGIEVPNARTSSVRLRDMLESKTFQKFTKENDLPIVLGKDISGECICASIAKMPHLLVAGATGSGKSVCIHSIILSLLCTYSPDQLQFIFVDPKQNEFPFYDGIPHLRTKVVVEAKKVMGALNWAIGEMERRYTLLAEQGSRDITSYNKKIREGSYVGDEDLKPLPFVVIVIDEFSDLMMTNGKELERSIVRLAQKSRAVGLHLIIATQRPSVETITGLIKSNIPTRIALRVISYTDSRTIIDVAGAEKLLGLGDMLYLNADRPKPKRIQGAFVSEEEIKAVVKYLVMQKKSWKDEEDEEVVGDENGEGEKIDENGELDLDAYASKERSKQYAIQDELFDEAKEIIIQAGEGSASLLQRNLNVGYNRASKLLDALEREGIVGPKDGQKPRKVLVGPKAFGEFSQQGEKEIDESTLT
ncbi:MAG: DNA translocase FtsK [Candidatus Moranbacteria bacterium]|nr:DNA translocase FtsK [Candidatus Moranbacteria bacterium]